MRSRMTVAMALVLCASAAFADGGFSAGSHAFVANPAQFVLQLGVLVFAAKTGGVLFDRWRLPVVLGELLAGVLVGPHLLGRVALPFFPKGLMCDVDVLLTPNGSVFSVVTLTLVVFFFWSDSIRMSGSSGTIRSEASWPASPVLPFLSGPRSRR